MKSILSDLRLFFIRLLSYIHHNYKGVRITLGCNVSRNAKIMASCLFTGNSIITSSAKIGSHTYGHDVNIQNARIGSYCSLGPSVKIGLDEHPLNEPSTHPKLYKSKPIQKISIIGDHVWIGAGAIILSGVSIGSHAVIAAGAVVTRDVDPFLIYGGIPARKIGELDRSLKLN